MNVTLIKPRIGKRDRSEYVEEGRMEPLQLAVLAGMLPGNIGKTFFDDRFEEIDFDKKTDLAALTVETFTARRSYEIAGEYRERGVPVVMGGMHPTLVPEEVSRYADAVCTGDAESNWLSVIEDFRNGVLKKFYKGVPGCPQNGIIPDKSIFAGKRYLPLSLIQFSRGCTSSCKFCATNAYFRKQHYVRPEEEIFGEIQTLAHKLIFFVDDNFTANPDLAKSFLKKLIPLKVRWVTQLSINAANDPELVSLLARSGCLGFVVGLESIRKKNLELMGKEVNLAHFKKYAPQINRLRDHGLKIWATFTLGHDHDTLSSIEDTINFALYWKFAFAAFNVLTPYPNTPLYEKLKNEDRLLYDGKWWLHPDYRFNYATFKPKHMTPEQLTEIGFRAKRIYNRPVIIMKRLFNHRTCLYTFYTLWLLLKYSPLFRREVYKKQGLILGRKETECLAHAKK